VRINQLLTFISVKNYEKKDVIHCEKFMVDCSRIISKVIPVFDIFEIIIYGQK